MTDDLSGIIAACPTAVIADISDGGTLSGNTIVWSGGAMAYNGSKSYTYTVDYDSCDE